MPTEGTINLNQWRRLFALTPRVGSAAGGDEILVSELLKALVEPSGEFAFDEGRKAELKGICGPQRVHAVEWR